MYKIDKITKNFDQFDWLMILLTYIMSLSLGLIELEYTGLSHGNSNQLINLNGNLTVLYIVDTCWYLFISGQWIKCHMQIEIHSSETLTDSIAIEWIFEYKLII